MKALFIGDIVGRSGRESVKDTLTKLNNESQYDLIIANGENSASGFGITSNTYKELISSGIDIITGGNHTWDRLDTHKDISSWDKFVRPLNDPEGTLGSGYKELMVREQKVCVISLLGRVFMGILSDDPFKAFDKIYDSVKDSFIIVDFHAEATSEKRAFAMYISGRANVVIGTHTHVQTNDLRVTSEGTLYLTDVGMCGALDSCIGMKKEAGIARFVSRVPHRMEVEMKGKRMFNAVEFESDTNKQIISSRLINILDRN